MDKALEAKVLKMIRFYIEEDFRYLWIEKEIDPKLYHKHCEEILEYEIYYYNRTGFWYSPTIK